MTQSTTPSEKLHRWQQISLGWLDKRVLVPRVRTAKQAVAIGIQLNLLKASLPHGEFSDRVNAMGISRATASRYMASARRFHAASEPFFEAINSASKLFELLPLDEANVLAKSEPAGWLTLGTISSMTVKELRAEVAKQKAEEGQQAVAKVSTTLGAEPAQSAEAKMFQALCQADLLQTPAKAADERATVRLNVQEERMLRRYRKCNPEGQEALLHLAGLLKPATA